MILVVDDHADTCDLMTFFLNAAGRDAVGTVCPVNALKLAHEDDFELIVLDDHMPVMTGVELMARLRANPRSQRTPIVFYSAGVDEDRITRALLDGADLWLRKGKTDWPSAVERICGLLN